MGTFGRYTGPKNIKADKIDEFACAVSKILNYGGMMHLRNVEMYNKKICLLDPVTIEKGKDVDFYYNYFEEDSWENAGYVYDNQHFYSNKIGSNEFNYVVTAVHCLYEHYDEGVGLPEENGDIVDSEFFIGWFNHLLGKNFSMAHRFRLWDKAESYALDRIEYDYPLKEKDLYCIIPKDLMKYAGGIDLSDLLYIINGTETLTEETVAPGTYPEDVLICKKAILAFIEKHGEEAYNRILELLHKPYDIRKNETDKDIKQVAESSLFLHARTILYLTCEMTGKKFWPEWNREKDKVYRDEKLKTYASDDILEYRKKGQEKPVKEVSTSEFLRNNGYFTFYNTPEELKDRPYYYVSDADRLYWWDGSDEVVINSKTEKWLQDVTEDYKEALAQTPEECDTQKYVKMVIELLYEVENRYKRVFAFQDMFYEFIANGTRKEYRAAIDVLRKLYEDNKEDAEFLKDIHNWEFTSKNVICISGRMNMKRYLALLANVKLREKYLGF